MEEHRRYRPRGAASPNPCWRAEVNTTPLASQRAPRPGPATDVDDERLSALRRRVVEPVVTSVLTPEEVEHLSVHWGIDGEEGDVWVRIDVPDQRHEVLLLSPWWVPDPGGDDGPVTEAQVAAHFGDQLEGWVCETSFAWGQQRRARYELPEA
ncbi:hypothetical protein [Kineococcus sp. SYSU DK005]|uniref:hypothetical protein n=1 Tax=Kineococcus sp. SYSU DK005 TaxID=3383126 RepID=UPI003D7CFA9A